MTNKDFGQRYIFIICAVAVLFFFYTYKLIQLQLVNGQQTRSQIEKSYVQQMAVEAPRGEIFDRNGVPLVTNRADYTIQFQQTSIKPDELNDVIINLIKMLETEKLNYIDAFPISAPPFNFTFNATDSQSANERVSAWLAQQKLPPYYTAVDVVNFYKNKTQFNIDSKYSDAEARKIMGVRFEMKKRNFGALNPYIFASDVNMNVVSKIKEQTTLYKGVNIDVRPMREYPRGGLAVHILGQTGLINAEEYAKFSQSTEKTYSQNDIVGKDGMERALETAIKGSNGSNTVEISSTGKFAGVTQQTPAVPGNSAYLTIDADLQALLEKALADNIASIRKIGVSSGKKNNGEDCFTGSAVVVDVNTGEVLAMASFPSFLPTTFNKDYNSLLKDEQKPMFNRAIAGAYPPGSTYKMITATAALETKVITPSDTIYDEGVYKFFPDFQPMCWLWSASRQSHGYENVTGALRDSCNYFFYDVGRRVGIDELTKYAKMFGVGQYTGIELSGESAGVLAGPEYRQKTNKQPWMPGNTLSAAIGQSDNLLTPVQLASYMSTLANGGNRYKIHLTKSINDYDTKKVVSNVAPTVIDKINIQKQNYTAILDGMRKVTEDGTASKVFADFPISVAGKTGTAEVTSGSNNGVFVAFAPFDKPKIAVSIVIEHGVHGNLAAPIARDVFQSYLIDSAR